MVDLADPNISQKLLSVKIRFGAPASILIIALIRSFRRILSMGFVSLAQKGKMIFGGTFSLPRIHILPYFPNVEKNFFVYRSSFQASVSSIKG